MTGTACRPAGALPGPPFLQPGRGQPRGGGGAGQRDRSRHRRSGAPFCLATASGRSVAGTATACHQPLLLPLHQRGGAARGRGAGRSRHGGPGGPGGPRRRHGALRRHEHHQPRINLDAIRNLAPLGAFYAPAPGMVAQGARDEPWVIQGAGAEAVPRRWSTGCAPRSSSRSWSSSTRPSPSRQPSTRGQPWRSRFADRPVR